MDFVYQVRLIHFKRGNVKELVVKNEDDSYTIFIEANLSYEEQKEQFNHAIGHIVNNDFNKDDVQTIEYEAHIRNAI